VSSSVKADVRERFDVEGGAEEVKQVWLDRIESLSFSL